MLGKIFGLKHQEGVDGQLIQRKLLTTEFTIELQKAVWVHCCFCKAQLDQSFSCW
jgi:hypothetical protein